MKLKAWIIVDKRNVAMMSLSKNLFVGLHKNCWVRGTGERSVPCTITIPDPKTKKGKKK